MWNPASSTVMKDMLFNLLVAFIALFYLTFIMISTKKQEEEEAKNDNNILITMRWKTDNDIDLWLRLPDGRKIWYSNRDEPPAHLDVDVVSWRRYKRSDGTEGIIDINEEIITIRGILGGEYAVNAHYFSARSVDPMLPIEVEILVQDIKNKKILYADVKKMDMSQKEVHFVKFTVSPFRRQGDIERYLIEKIYTDRPTYFVGQDASSRPSSRYSGGPGGEGYPGRGYPGSGNPEGQEGIPPSDDGAMPPPSSSQDD